MSTLATSRGGICDDRFAFDMRILGAFVATPRMLQVGGSGDQSTRETNRCQAAGQFCSTKDAGQK
jgi:hypothetical protein